MLRIFFFFLSIQILYFLVATCSSSKYRHKYHTYVPLVGFEMLDKKKQCFRIVCYYSILLIAFSACQTHRINKFQKVVPPRIARPKANPKNGKVSNVLPYLVVGIVNLKKYQKFYVGEDVICTFRNVGLGTCNINIDKFVSILRDVSRRLNPLSIDKRPKWKFREKWKNWIIYKEQIAINK